MINNNLRVLSKIARFRKNNTELGYFHICEFKGHTTRTCRYNMKNKPKICHQANITDTNQVLDTLAEEEASEPHNTD